MYKVTISNVDSPDVVVSVVKTLEEACSLALALHRSSNAPHYVGIHEGDNRVVVFVLEDSKTQVYNES